jgi:addiction module HigA family antidote
MPLTIPENRRPTPPGEMLVEEFLKPAGVSQAQFARHIGVPYVRLNEIANGRRGITPDTAVRFSRALGTTPQFWLNGQMAIDLYDELHAPGATRKINPLPEFARAS